MVLKQRANFYNNIATEMVQCQKPMMLKDALDFEKVLMNPKDAQVRLFQGNKLLHYVGNTLTEADNSVFASAAS